MKKKIKVIDDIEPTGFYFEGKNIKADYNIKKYHHETIEVKTIEVNVTDEQKQAIELAYMTMMQSAPKLNYTMSIKGVWIEPTRKERCLWCFKTSCEDRNEHSKKALTLSKNVIVVVIVLTFWFFWFRWLILK